MFPECSPFSTIDRTWNNLTPKKEQKKSHLCQSVFFSHAFQQVKIFYGCQFVLKSKKFFSILKRVIKVYFFLMRLLLLHSLQNNNWGHFGWYIRKACQFFQRITIGYIGTNLDFFFGVCTCCNSCTHTPPWYHLDVSINDAYICIIFAFD